MLATTSSPILTSADLKANLSDIQDNIVAPILMRYRRHVFLKFTDGVRARTWLREIFNRVNARSEEHGTRFSVNIGFTYEWLKVLGLSQRSLDTFPQALQMGIRARASLVGDVGPNSPQFWEGGLGAVDMHAMAYFRTDSEEGREDATDIMRAEMDATGGVEVRFVQDTTALANENGIGSEGEHFGFADPISQPPIEGADAPHYPGDRVLEPEGTWRPLKPGEFLLGYGDESGANNVPRPGPFELRVNGTFMVFRKLYQDLAAFRRYLAKAAKGLFDADDPYHQDLVAAKMMGLWRSGCPLDLSPEADDPEIASDPMRRNNFSYAGDDHGQRRPRGSHLRRVNPRETPLKRATTVRQHRLIRRGVEYGPRLPEGVLEDDGVDRGLVQLLIQADIERQFEFIQKEWMAGGEFIGLDRDERDPIAGVGSEGSQLSAPGRQATVPVRLAHLRRREGWRIPVRAWAERAQGHHRTEILNSRKVRRTQCQIISAALP